MSNLYRAVAKASQTFYIGYAMKSEVPFSSCHRKKGFKELILTAPNHSAMTLRFYVCNTYCAVSKY